MCWRLLRVLDLNSASQTLGWKTGMRESGGDRERERERERERKRERES